MLGKSSDLSELVSLIVNNNKSYFSGLWKVYDVKYIYRLMLKNIGNNIIINYHNNGTSFIGHLLRVRHHALHTSHLTLTITI